MSVERVAGCWWTGWPDGVECAVLHAYEHTEAFVRDVCAKIFAQAFVSKFNIIMEKLECLTHIEVMTPVKNTAWYQGYVYSRPLLVSTPNAVFGLPREPLQHREIAFARRA